MTVNMDRSLFLVLLLLLPPFISFASCSNSIGHFCNQEKPISTGSPILANIDQVLAKLLTGVASSGFALAANGQGSTRVYGLLQCRGDVSTEECTSCAADAVKQIRQLCPSSADSRIWFDYCFLRYDTDNFVGKLDTGYSFAYYNVQNVMEPKAFAKRLGGLMEKVRGDALVPGNKALGRDETQFSPFITIYGLAQCTRDLPSISCAQCLSIAIARFPSCCGGSQGGQVHFSSCFARFEIYPFFYPLNSSPQKNAKQPLHGFFRNTSRIIYYPYAP